MIALDLEMVLEATIKLGASIERSAQKKGEDPLGSHLLGMPYVEAGDIFPPCSKVAAKWKLMAQINFEDMAGMLMPLFPEQGLLQLFVEDTSGLGFNIDEQGVKRPAYYCRFVKSPNKKSWDQERAHELRYPEHGLKQGPHGPCMPLKKATGLSFKPMEQTLLPTDEAGKKEYPDIVKSIEVRGSAIESMWWDHEWGPFSQVGGYAFFTKWDPRDTSEPWEVLFQLDSDAEWGVIWGYGHGVGSVSIRRSDLERGDFSRMIFNWDAEDL